MHPWIWANGWLHVRRCRLEDLRGGDIAVWFDGRSLLSHRIVSIAGQTFVTKGDWSRATDPPATAHQLVGKATRYSRGPISYRLDGWLVSWLARLSIPAQTRGLLRAFRKMVRRRAP